MKKTSLHMKFAPLAVQLLTCAFLLLLSSGVAPGQGMDTGPAINHKLVQIQGTPICLGVSGYDDAHATLPATANTGTLGSLVQDLNTGNQYILSNAHILAPFGAFAIGDPINHVGSADTVGFQGTMGIANVTLFPPNPISYRVPYPVANLTDYRCNAFADAAIAQVINGTVSNAILDIPGFNTVIQGPLIGETVLKSGRTTGLTYGTIRMVNMTFMLSVSCSGGPQTYNNLIQVVPLIPVGPRGPGNMFTEGGDSGSLVLQIQRGVTPLAPTIGPVGLHFAADTVMISWNGQPAINTRVAYEIPMSDVVNQFAQAPPGQPTYNLRFVPPAACTRVFPPTHPPAENQAADERNAEIANEPSKLQGIPAATGNVPDPKAVEAVAKIKSRYSALLLAVPNAIGHGVALSSSGSGEIVIKLLVLKITDETKRAAPNKLDGVPVELEVASELELE